MKRVVLTCIVVMFAAFSATPANNATQITFSDTGALMTLNENQKARSTPYGFWVWCNGAAAPNSNGGYQAANACQGSMYFYALQTKATHVVGFATEIPVGSGIFTMHVAEGTPAQLFSGTLNPSYMCTLANATPNESGPGSTVQVGCMFTGALGGGTGSETDTGAVVNITGPN